MRPATFQELKQFCDIDGWHESRSTSHVIYTKELADGRSLRTQTSHSPGKTPSPGLWKTILRAQLEVTEEQFWAAMASGDAVDRSSPTEATAAPTVAHKTWVVAVLAGDLRMTPAEIEALSVEEAVDLVNEYYSRPKES